MTKVLIAEDDLELRALLGRGFIDVGYEVIETDDGASTLEQAQRELPDVILLDVMMPVMDGFEVLREFRRDVATQFIPVIMITAVNAQEGEP